MDKPTVETLVKSGQKTADQAVDHLLLLSRSEYGTLSLQMEELRVRREEVRQHIAALEKVQELSKGEKPK